MRYFKSESALKAFIRHDVVNTKKSEEHFFFTDRFENEIFLKNSTKKYKSIDDIVDELRDNGLVFDIIHRYGAMSLESEDMGCVLLYTQMMRYLNRNDEYLNNEVNKFKLLTINQVGEFLSISRPSVYKLLNDKKLPFIEILGQKRIQLNELLKYIQSNQSQ